jgi:hypothetical protein
MTIITSIISILALAGCGADTTSTPSPTDLNQDDTKVRVVHLDDGRKVTCVIYEGYKAGGISCDWNHMDGADNLENK